MRKGRKLLSLGRGPWGRGPSAAGGEDRRDVLQGLDEEGAADEVRDGGGVAAVLAHKLLHHAVSLLDRPIHERQAAVAHRADDPSDQVLERLVHGSGLREEEVEVAMTLSNLADTVRIIHPAANAALESGVHAVHHAALRQHRSALLLKLPRDSGTSVAERNRPTVWVPTSH